MTGSAERYRFGSFELDLGRRELLRDGHRVPLQDKPYDLLAELVRQSPRVVSREELRLALWGAETFVDVDHGLNTAVRKLREALGDDAQAPRFVETVARHGYRFAAAIEAVPPAAPAAAIPEPGPQAAHPRRKRRSLWIAVPLGLLVVVAVGFRLAGIAGEARQAPPPAIRSLAVLPLVNLSGDPEQEYFADGMTEELITELARVGAWRVTSRTSVMAFKGKQSTLPEIARELGVDGVIEGSVVRAGDRVKVTVQLLDARADRHLWADSFERRAADVLLLQGEIAGAVVRQVSVQLRARPSANARSVDPAAYDAYLRGRFFWNRRTAEGFKKALGEFTRATTLDPEWPLGWVGLADTYGLMAISTYDLMSPGEAMPKARDAATRALALNDELAEAHTALAWVHFTFDWDFAAAEREFRRAIDLDPNYATAHQWYSNYLCAMGRLDDAQAEIAQALVLDPLSLVINNEAAWPDYYARRFDESDAHYRRVLELDPAYPTAHLELGMNQAARARFPEAIAEYELAQRAAGDAPESLAFLAHAEAGRGDRGRARRLRDQLVASAGSTYVPSYAVAIAELGLGEHGRALDALERAFASREDALLYLAVEPLFDPLRGEPRFEALLRRIGLPARLAGLATPPVAARR